MKKLLLVLITLLVLCSSLFAGNTAVTATITGTDGQTWNNGTYIITFRPNPNIPGPYTVNGATFNQGPITGSLSASGVLTVTLTDNATIQPSGSKWQFKICPNATAQCLDTFTTVTGGAQNLSTTLSAAAPVISVPATPIKTAYQNSQVTTPAGVGSSYFDTLLNIPKYWDGSAWSLNVYGLFKGVVPDGTDLGVAVNAKLATITGAGDVLIMPGTYTSNTTITLGTNQRLLCAAGVTATFNAPIVLGNGSELIGPGGTYLQSSGYPDVGTKSCNFINNQNAGHLVSATVPTNQVWTGLIINGITFMGKVATGTSGDNIRIDASAVGAAVRNAYIEKTYSHSAKDYNLHVIGNVFELSIDEQSFFANAGTDGVLLDGGVGGIIGQIQFHGQSQSNGAVGLHIKGTIGDVYVSNGQLSANPGGGLLSESGRIVVTNEHFEGNNLFAAKFTATSGSVWFSDIVGDSATSKGIWFNGTSTGSVGQNTCANNAALSDIVIDNTISQAAIFRPRVGSGCSVTDNNLGSTYRFDVWGAGYGDVVTTGNIHTPGYIYAGNPAVGLLAAGDGSFARSATTGAIAIGSDANVYFYRSAVSTTELAGTTLAVGSGGSAGKAMCWKGDGKTLGYCSTVVDAGGACTCN